MVSTLVGKRPGQAFLDHSFGLVDPFRPSYHESDYGGNWRREGRAAFLKRFYRY